MHAAAARDGQARFLNYENQIRALIPAPRKGARILLLSDADGPDAYDVHSLIRLTYGDASLEPQRMTVLKESHVQVDPASYDYVLDWIGGRFVLLSHKEPRA